MSVPPAGAVVRDCRVTETHHYGDYARITLIAPDLAERSRPGQFVMVGVPTPSFHLRRPLSRGPTKPPRSWPTADQLRLGLF